MKLETTYMISRDELAQDDWTLAEYMGQGATDADGRAYRTLARKMLGDERSIEITESQWHDLLAQVDVLAVEEESGMRDHPFCGGGA